MATKALTGVGGTIAHEHEIPALTTGGSAGPFILTGSVDPSAGAGVAAPIAALYLRNTGTAGTLWVKTGAADTAWTLVTLAA